MGFELVLYVTKMSPELLQLYTNAKMYIQRILFEINLRDLVFTNLIEFHQTGPT